MSQQTVRLLLVDDESSLREPLAKYLRQNYRYEVYTAANGQEVLAKLKQTEGGYDVALIDDMLVPAPGEEPRPLGLKLTKEIKSNYPKIEVILFTGWGMESGLAALRLGAYRYLSKPFNREELGMLIQAAAEHSHLKSIAREKQILEQLMGTSTALLSGQNLPEMLDTILQGVQAVGYDRVGLYLISENEHTLVGQAQVGMGTAFVGHERPVAKDTHMKALMDDPRAQIFERKKGDALPYEKELEREDVYQWACIPLILRGKVIGKLSMDNKFSQRPIVEAELDPLTIFASQAAAAIEHARLRDKEQEATQKAEQRARNLAAIQEISTTISSIIELDKTLKTICRAAVELFSVDHSGLVLFEEPWTMPGKVVSEYPDLGTYGLKIPITGVPFEEELIASGEPLTLTEFSDEVFLGPIQKIFREFDIQSILIMPIVIKRQVIGSFSLDAIGRSRTFSEEEIEMCKIFAAQVAVAVENAKTHMNVKTYVEKLEILHKIDTEIVAALDLDHILESIAKHIVDLVEARKSLFILVDTKRNCLLKVKGYGYPPDHLQGLSFEEVKAGVSGWVLENRQATLVSDARNDPRNKGIALERAKHFNSAPLIVAPLLIKDEVIGTLTAVNTSDDSPFTEEDLNLVIMLANQAAIAIENAHLYQETKMAQERLRSSYEASNALVSSLDPEQVLQNIVEKARVAAGAAGVNMMIIDELGQARHLITADPNEEFDFRDLLRPNGVSMRVMYTGRPEIFEDTSKVIVGINRSVFWHSIAAALCLPVFLEGKRIGVMWLHYDHIHHFSEAEIEALQFYVNQAAIAFDNSRRIKELEYLRKAAETLARTSTISEVLEQIVQCAQQVFQADSAVIWSYDTVQDRFILEKSVATSITPDHWAEFQKIGPQQGGTTYTVMKEGWIGISDVNDFKGDELLGKTTQNLLKQFKARSFQAVALIVDDEKLGVLYANYYLPRSFGEEDEETALIFANQAALALRNVKLLDQVSAARNTAKVVAEVTTLADIHHTLFSVVKGTKEVLGCDAVIVYVYDQYKGRVNYPPAMIGVRFPDKVLRISERPQDSFVLKILEHDKMYIARDTVNDPLFKERRFTEDEEIATCVAMVLKVDQKRAGVMFVNYRTQHRFIRDELANIELFANQAAVAIYNAQLYQEVSKRLEESNALQQVAISLTGVSGLNEVLNLIMAEAMKVTGTHEGSILFWDAKSEKFTQAFRVDNEGVLRLYHSAVRSKDGLTRKVINEQKTVIISDALQEPQANPTFVAKGYRGTINVPLLSRGEVFGVLDVRSRESCQFSDRQVALLETLAGQATVAIDRARQYEELKQTKGLVGARTALAWMGMVSAVWRHAIEGHAVTIREEIDHIRTDSDQVYLDRVDRRLAKIRRLSEEILDKPITPPLSEEEGVESVPVNELLKERFRQLWRNEPYKSAKLISNYELDDTATVRASPDWLRRVFDVIVDNALEAMSDVTSPKLTVSTRTVNSNVEIAFTDIGPGISEAILPKLFHKQIEKSKGAKGLGIGLLMAHTITQTYGGEILVETTDAMGTSMVISLPIETRIPVNE